MPGSSLHRVRNPDLLTSIDILTTGKYARLGSIHQVEFVPKKPLSRVEIADIFRQTEDVMRARLLAVDIVPIEMSNYRIGTILCENTLHSANITHVEGGRTFFTVAKRFEASLIMTGAQADDFWAFVHVEFLFKTPSGDNKSVKRKKLSAVWR